MLQKTLHIVRILTVPICFLIFIGLNYIFMTLYCNPISDTAWAFTLFWSTLLCGILAVLPVTIRRIGIILFTSIFALMNLVHAIMYNLFGNFFAFSDLLYAGEGAAFFSLTYLNARKLLWLTSIGAIALGIFLAVNLKKRKYHLAQPIIGIIAIVIAVCGISSEHNGILSKLETNLTWDSDLKSNNDADIYLGFTNKNHTMSLTGIYQYLYRSFMITSGLENQLNNGDMYANLDKYFQLRAETIHTENEMSGIYEGKNVLFIMLESIDTWMLTEDYMPNLYAVQQRSMNFVNHYSPLYISAGTFNTEFVANTSLIPPASGVSNKVYIDNTYPYSIANSFNAAGYTSNSFHSSNPTIYNRGAIHENLGYIKYHSHVDMGMDNYQLDSQMINAYDKMVAGEPFFSFIITYSGHGPYTDEMSTISKAHLEFAKQKVNANPINASASDLSEYTYAIAHAMETDAFIGSLMAKLKADDLLKDTILVFYTDHFGKYMTNHQLLMDIKGVNSKDKLCNTPFFIYDATSESKTIETISSTMDILPTIANMFGLDVKYEYFTGVDIFSDNEHYVIFPGNNWYDGNIYYSPNYTGEYTEEIAAKNKEVSERMKYSEYVLRSDYFKYITNK